MEVIRDAADGFPSPNRKRYCAPIPSEKTMVILVNSRIGMSVLGMFKFNIKINNNTNDSNTRDEKKPLIVLISEGEEIHEKDPLNLKPVKTFFDLDPDEPIYPQRRIDGVACCQFQGFPDELYLIPDDILVPDEDKPVSPLLYNFRTNLETPIHFLKESKCNPIAAAIRERVYVLSTGHESDSPEPRFEEYHPTLMEWMNSPTTPFTCGNHFVTGYVVLKDKFIVVCISFGLDENKSEFYSYNALSGKWKPVKQQPCLDHLYDKGIEAKIYPDSTLCGECVVLFDTYDKRYGIIFSYKPSFKHLLRFSYTDETIDSVGPTEHDLSLGPACLVKGFEIKKIEKDYGFDSPCENESCVVAKVAPNILCVLHADPYFYAEPVMNVSGSIIQIEHEDSATCTTLRTFLCNLFLGEELGAAYIQSCLILQLEEQKDNRSKKCLKEDYSTTSEYGAEMEVI